MARTAGAGWEHGWALIFLATLALARADNAEAIAFTYECDRVLGAAGDREAHAWCSAIRGGARWAARDGGGAGADLPRALHEFQELGGLWGLSLSMLLAGFVIGSAGRPEAAIPLLAVAESLRASIGVVNQPFIQAWLAEALASVRAAVDPGTFGRSWAAGTALAADEALAETLAQLRLLQPDPAEM